jgi:predicted dehydrogenase
MAIIREWVDSGSIGTPVLAQANTWVNYGATEPDGTWYDNPQRCPAAPIFRIGIYMLNNLLQVFGEPVEVQVTAQRFLTKRPTPDNASLTIGFADGGIVNIVASFAIGGPDTYKSAMTIGGTKGVIYFASGPQPRDGGGTKIVLSTDDRLERRELTGASGDYDWDFFAKRVRGEIRQDVTTPMDIVRAIHVVRAMSAAESSGETVRVEKFQATEANAAV